MQSLFPVDTEIGSDPMAAHDFETRLQEAEASINRLKERAAKLEGWKEGQTHPAKESKGNSLLITVISIVGAAFVGYWGWLGVEVVGIGKDVASLKASVGALQQSQAETYLNAAEREVKLGDKNTAKQHVEKATALLERLISSPVPAPASFFEQSAEKLDRLSSSVDYADTHQAFVRLAEYRSALQIAHDLHGTTFNCAPGSKVETFFAIDGDPSKANRFLGDLILTNCPQTLDGFTWKNVVFINDNISYKGGPLILDNVRFIHCTFNTPQTDDGVRVLQYAALDENSLKVKPEFFGKPPIGGL